MSFSQKHQGKVLTPWFNSTEWESVKNYIYTPPTNWEQALLILKVWKLRTPLLSAGVEGTLIVVEALAMKTEEKSDFETTHVLSTSLIRFLNLCAANSDKQGTFYRTAMQNELPKWLINIRHDIAHSHKVPTKSILTLALKFCLGWLKSKYWDEQGTLITDLEVAEPVNDATFDAYFRAFYDFSRKLHFGGKIKGSQTLRKRLHTLLQIRGDEELDDKKLFGILCNKIAKLIRVDRKKFGEQLCAKLLENILVLLVADAQNEDGERVLPFSAIKTWRPLLKVMHDAEVLQLFVNKLLAYLLDERNGYKYRETASLWIGNIYAGLNNKQPSTYDDDIKFSTGNYSMKNKLFVYELLEKPTKFTNIYIREVLEYNNASSNFIEDSISLIQASLCERSLTVNEIQTVNDLEIRTEDLVIKTRTENGDEVMETDGMRWALITDTKAYKNIPLGVLPHQNRRQNPLFV